MQSKEKANTNKKYRVSFRLTDQELENLNTAAKRVRVSPSEYIRQCLNDEPIQIVYYFEADSEEFTEIVDEVAVISGRVNLIAKYLNGGGRKSAELEGVIFDNLEKLCELRARLRKLINELRTNTNYFNENNKEV